MSCRGSWSERGSASSRNFGSGGMTGGKRLGGSIDSGSLGAPGSGLNCSLGEGDGDGEEVGWLGVGPGISAKITSPLPSCWRCSTRACSLRSTSVSVSWARPSVGRSTTRRGRRKRPKFNLQLPTFKGKTGPFMAQSDFRAAFVARTSYHQKPRRLSKYGARAQHDKSGLRFASSDARSSLNAER